MLAGYIVNVVEIVEGSSVCRLPSGVTKEPGREDDQDRVENYEQRCISATDTEGGGAGRRTKEGENQPNVSPSILEAHV